MKIKIKDINGNWVWYDTETKQTTSAEVQQGTIRNNAVKSVGADTSTKRGRVMAAHNQTQSYNRRQYKVHNYADQTTRLKQKQQTVSIDKQWEPTINQTDYTPNVEAPMIPYTPLEEMYIGTKILDLPFKFGNKAVQYGLGRYGSKFGWNEAQQSARNKILSDVFDRQSQKLIIPQTTTLQYLTQKFNPITTPNEEGALTFFQRKPSKISSAERMGIPKGERNQQQNDITSRFLKFVNGDGNPITPAMPRTQAELELYGYLKGAGIDMDKISLKDIRTALKLREQELMSSGKSFSYQQPVTSRAEIIHSVDNGAKTGYISLVKPFQSGENFNQEMWEQYISNPRKHGLGISMVENSTQVHPEQYNEIQHGIQERLTNSAIDVAKQQGYEGVVSGEALLSPEKTIKMYPKYKHKRLLDENGRYHWQDHNPGMAEQNGPVYMLEQPTYETITKSQVFNPRIIDKNGKMKINWGKGATLFNSIASPLTLYYATK